MKILGITAEYNPFHNGHLYHVTEAAREVKPDCTVAVMSGNFTQRGEASILDKWQRGRNALELSAGKINAVFELPFAFACNRAEYFAKGGVDTLVKLGAEYISFGCETGNHDALRETAKGLVQKADQLAELTGENMKSGISHAKAYEKAVEVLLGAEAAEIIQSPNNILAVEYLKRIEYWKDRGRNITDVPVTRHGSGYRETGDGYAGASEIRRLIKEGKDVSEYVPEGIDFGDAFTDESRLFDFLKAAVMRSSNAELAEIYGIGEGFENKIIKELAYAKSMDDYVERLTSRRYTSAAVRRMLAYILTGVKGSDMDRMVQEGQSYARLLAADETGRGYIRQFESDEMAVVTNSNKYMPDGGSADEMILQLDIKAADIYNLLAGRDMYDMSDKVLRPFII